MIRHAALSLALLLSVATAPAVAQRTPLSHTDTITVPHHKSPSTALWLSLGATALPALTMDRGITAAGLALGPAVGLFYAGAPGRGLLGVGIRSAVSLAAGVAVLVDCDGVDDDICGITPILIGGSLILASDIWDIVTAPNAAKRWDTRHKVMPIVAPVRGGVGIGVRVGL